MNLHYCNYFQAIVSRPESWFVVSVLKSFEHLCFDRTIDSDQSVFEFFVPQASQTLFLDLMSYFEKNGLVSDLKELPNRLLDHSQNI